MTAHDDRDRRLEALLGPAAGDVTTPPDLAPELVARGRRRRARQRLASVGGGVALTAVGLVGVSAVVGGDGPRPVVVAPDGDAPREATDETTERSTGSTSTRPAEDGDAPASSGGDGNPAAADSAGGTGTSAPQPGPTGDPDDADDGAPRSSSAPGVTADTITLWTVHDGTTGPMVSSSASYESGVAAAMAWFDEEVGNVHGRRVVVERRSTDTTGDPTLDQLVGAGSYQTACDEAFALVAGGPYTTPNAAQIAEACDLPDLRAETWRPIGASTTFSLGWLDATDWADGVWRGRAERFGDAVTSAAYVYVDFDEHDSGAIPPSTLDAAQEAGERAGYDWIVTERYSPGAMNWARVVQELAAAGVEVVHFHGTPSDLTRFRNSAWQYDFDVPVSLSEVTLKLAVASEVVTDLDMLPWEAATSTLPLEDDFDEMALFRRWWRTVEPNHAPTHAGLYGWAATRLMLEQLEAIGPEPTRQALLDQLDALENVTVGGVFSPRALRGPFDVTCWTTTHWVAYDGWHRALPSQPGTFDCAGD